MSLLGLIALISGVLGVWLTIRQNVLCWPMALISVVTSGTEFYQSRLFGDMSLQVMYFISGVYGWIYWEQNRNKDFKVERMPVTLRTTMIMVTVAQAVLYYFLLRYFEGARPLGDAILTAASITATYMMTRKWVENWILWVVIDAAYIFLYASTALWTYALLYFFFSVMAFYGWQQWRKKA